MSRDYAAIGWTYAHEVVAGTIPTGKLSIKACQRSLDDLAGLEGFRFDPARAARVCSFVEHLSHVKGHLGGKLISLEPWQIWLLSQVFGWVCDGGFRDGMRRFRTAYIAVPRGNAKSTLSSGVALYMLAADGEFGADVTSSATTSQQARIVWGDAAAMARAPVSQKLMQALGVTTHAHSISVVARNSKFVPTSSEYNSLDGLNLHCGLVDELHAHSDRGLWDVLCTGAGKRAQSLIWAITTAGSDRASVCYEQHEYTRRLLTRVVTDETYFGVIWEADDTADWQDPEVWRLANPNWGVSVEPAYIESLAVKAKNTPAAVNAFRVKHLNQWVSTDSPWMDMLAWDRCRDEQLDMRNFEGDSCFIGLDLAAKTDICAKAYLFRRVIAGVSHFYAFSRYYLPEGAIADGRNSQYKGWSLSGHLTETPGEVIDFAQVEDDLMDDSRRYGVQEVAYDPWQATQLSQRMMNNGANMIEYRQTVQNFSAPMKELEALVKSGRLHHNDPVLTWMIANVVCHYDNKDNVFPKKDRPEQKIDGVIALIMAVGRQMANDSGDITSLFLS